MSEQDPVLQRLAEIDNDLRELIAEIEFGPLKEFMNQTLFPSEEPAESGEE